MDAEIVKRELCLELSTLPQVTRKLVANLCRLSMAELLSVATELEALGHENAPTVRKVFERRRDCAQLRSIIEEMEALRAAALSPNR